MPLWLQGAVELALVAALSYLAVVLLLAAVWYTNGFDNSTFAGAASVAGHIWLLVHGVPLAMDIPAQGAFSAVSGTMSLMPLGLTLIPLALCFRSGRRLARASYEGQFWQPLLGGMGAYALVSLAVSALSTGAYFATSPVFAALIPLWVVVLGVLAGGYAESRSLAAMIGVNAADWVKKFSQYSRWAGSYIWAVVRAALVSVLALGAGGALLLALTIFWHWDDVIALYQTLRAGAVGGTALTLLQLGLIPNFVVFAMAWSSGAGFALGTGTSIDLTGTDAGVMPALPILGALPHASYPLGLLALVVPVAAGAVGGWWFFREGENHLDEWFALKTRFRWISLPLSTLCLAILSLVPTFTVTALLGWVANGSLGLGRFTEIGPNPLLFGLYAAVLLAVGIMLGLGLAHLLVRDTTGELDRFAEDADSHKARFKRKRRGKKAHGAEAEGHETDAEETAGSVRAETVEDTVDEDADVEPVAGMEPETEGASGEDEPEAEDSLAPLQPEEEAAEAVAGSEEELSEVDDAAGAPEGEEQAAEIGTEPEEEPQKTFRPVIRRPKSRRRS